MYNQQAWVFITQQILVHKARIRKAAISDLSNSVLCYIMPHISFCWAGHSFTKALYYSQKPQIRDRLRFFYRVGHQTTNVSSGNKHFFTKYWLHQTYQNYEQPCQRWKISKFWVSQFLIKAKINLFLLMYHLFPYEHWFLPKFWTQTLSVFGFYIL